MSHTQRLAAGFVLLVIAVSADAQNLVVNPNFGTDLSGWTVKTTGAATATFSTDTGSPDQGSVHLTATNGETAQLNQCVSVTSGSVDLFARTYSVSAVSNAGAQVTAFDQAGCVGNPLGFSAFNVTPVNGFLNGNPVTGWTELSALHENISNLPPVSASVVVFVTPGAGQTADYYFDDIRFGTSGTTPVRLQSFGVQ
jgi:hypothetical protein